MVTLKFSCVILPSQQNHNLPSLKLLQYSNGKAHIPQKNDGFSIAMLDCRRAVRVLPVVINTSLPFVSIPIESELGCRSFHSVPIPIHSTHGKIKKAHDASLVMTLPHNHTQAQKSSPFRRLLQMRATTSCRSESRNRQEINGAP